MHMEGTQGITIETPIPIAPTLQPSTEKSAGKPGENKPADSVKKELKNPKEEPIQEANTEEQPLTEKREEIFEVFKKLGEHLSAETKEQIFDEYLSELLSVDKKTNQHAQLVDTFADMVRVLKLMFALIILQITNPKDVYSGKDLNLSNNPPEGEDKNSQLTKLINGQDSRESWENFRKEVDGIENVSFSELMSRVLAANEKNSVKRLRLAKQFDHDETLAKKLSKLSTAGRKGRQSKPQAVRKAA